MGGLLLSGFFGRLANSLFAGSGRVISPTVAATIVAVFAIVGTTMMALIWLL